MPLPANQRVTRSAAIRAVELKSEFHQELVRAACAIVGCDNTITAEHIEAAVARAAEQIARKYSGTNEIRPDARANAA